MKNIWLAVSLLLLSVSSFAECDFQQATVNGVLGKTLGISGDCTAEKAAAEQTTKTVDESLDPEAKKVKDGAMDKKDSIESDINTTKNVMSILK
nr:hypothetical protein [uncultured Moellerella sp.]